MARPFFLLMVAVPTAFTFFTWQVFGDGSCRVLEFLVPEIGRRLKHHVIHSTLVDLGNQCQLQCYLDSTCLSYNLGTQGPGNKFLCELSDSDHHAHPKDLVDEEGFWYNPTASLCDGMSCPPAASCIPNKQGKLRCVCPSNWTDMGNCEPDVDECSDATAGGSGVCPLHAQCTNTIGSFICNCHQGFTGDGPTCVNIDECKTGSHKCHVNATCTDTEGNYTCMCNDDVIGDGLLCIGFPFHWTLNGSDPFLRVYHGSYEAIDGRNVLFLKGSNSYAETPAIPLQKVSFSILCWIKVLSPPTDNPAIHIYSDWSEPHQFRFYIYEGKLCADLRGPSTDGSNMYIIVGACGRQISINQWTHVALTWSREGRIAKLYQNGTETGTTRSITDPAKNIDLNPNDHTVYDIGLKRDHPSKDVTFHGYLRDLIVINRAIIGQEVKDIMVRNKL